MTTNCLYFQQKLIHKSMKVTHWAFINICGSCTTDFTMPFNSWDHVISTTSCQGF